MIAILPAVVFTIGLTVVCVALVWAAWTDIRSFTIPNFICASVALAYITALFVLPANTWFMGLVTGVIVLIVGSILFAQKWVGGGDVKLAAAVALWAGPTLFADWVVVTSIAGAVLATALLITPLPRLLGRSHGRDTGFDQPMPFGVALAVGGVWVVGQQLTMM